MKEEIKEKPIFRVYVRWPGRKDWSEIEDPGDYSLRYALRKCEIDAYFVEMPGDEEWQEWNHRNPIMP